MFSFPMAKFQYPKWDYQKWNAVEFRLCRPSAAAVPALGSWRALGMHLCTDVSVWYSCLKPVLRWDGQLTYLTAEILWQAEGNLSSNTYKYVLQGKNKQ